MKLVKKVWYSLFFKDSEQVADFKSWTGVKAKKPCNPQVGGAAQPVASFPCARFLDFVSAASRAPSFEGSACVFETFCHRNLYNTNEVSRLSCIFLHQRGHRTVLLVCLDSEGYSEWQSYAGGVNYTFLLVLSPAAHARILKAEWL